VLIKLFTTQGNESQHLVLICNLFLLDDEMNSNNDGGHSPGGELHFFLLQKGKKHTKRKGCDRRLVWEDLKKKRTPTKEPKRCNQLYVKRPNRSERKKGQFLLLGCSLRRLQRWRLLLSVGHRRSYLKHVLECQTPSEWDQLMFSFQL